jgi:hypothetical protein
MSNDKGTARSMSDRQGVNADVKSSTDIAMQEDEVASAEVALVTDKALLETFASMALMIPSEAGGGTEDILRKILDAQTWDELDAPWETSSIDDILGKQLRITAAKRRPSSFKSGLGIFLVLTLTDTATGDVHVKTTGSIAVVGQVARAYALDALPAVVEWVRAARPTENGYYPQHLKFLASLGGKNGNGDKQ